MSPPNDRPFRTIDRSVERDQRGVLVADDRSSPGDIEVRTVGVGDRPVADHEALYKAYGRFRAWVYTTVSNILDPDVLNPDGTDFDRYDASSIHLAALETVLVDGQLRRRVVGSTRVIFDLGALDHPYVAAGLKPNLGRLPVEEDFPELAANVDVRENRIRCEVSRYAAHHHRSTRQRRITQLLRAGIGAVFTNAGAETGYAVLEDNLADLLRRDGVAVEQLTAPRFLAHYRSVNFGARLDLAGMAAWMGTVTDGLPPDAIRIGNEYAISRRPQAVPELRVLEC